MRLLFIGDMVGPASIDLAAMALRRLKRDQAYDAVIANAENLSVKNGLSESEYRALLQMGVDLVTLGNHAWDNKDIYNYIDEAKRLVRPFNYPPGTPGVGWRVMDTGKYRLAVVSALGNALCSALPSPFLSIDALVDQLIEEGIRHIVVDIHAEATSEKTTLGYYLDGRVSAVLGTHTHVPTADECILPRGTAYQTDVGMTGPYESVIGLDIGVAKTRFTTQRPTRYRQAPPWPGVFNATSIVLNGSGQAVEIKRHRYILDERGGLL